MEVVNVALLGFGTVGQGIYEAIETHQEKLQNVTGKKVKVVAVLVNDVTKERSLSDEVLVTTKVERLFSKRIDVVMEAMVGLEPAFSILQNAIQRGSHIITANKQMFAQHGASLQLSAQDAGVSVGFEATTASGTPVIRTIQQLLQVNQVEKIEGILNGTSNFILTEMEDKGLSFHEALQLAQEKGYAEADPTNDVEGIDAFCKLMILSELAFGKQPDRKEIDIKGINEVTSSTLQEASFLDKRVKHVATLERRDNRLCASIQPIQLNQDHPLYKIDGVQNAVSIQTNIAGTLVLEGPGAGKQPTASAMIEDLVHILKLHKSKENNFINVV